MYEMCGAESVAWEPTPFVRNDGFCGLAIAAKVWFAEKSECPEMWGVQGERNTLC